MSASSLHRDPDWTAVALCRQVDGDLFFPNKGETDRRAKQVCASCEVKPECLAYALERGEVWGIWGGTSESERRQMRRDRREASC